MSLYPMVPLFLGLTWSMCFAGLFVALRFVLVTVGEGAYLAVCFGKTLYSVGCSSKRKMWKIM